MTGSSDRLRERARAQRRIGATILVTFVVWAVVQFAGARFGMTLRWAGLVDLVALAVLGWAVVMTLGLWRTRKE